MEKVIVIIALLFLASCSKEDSQPCNCGKILSDDPNDYSVVIRNECSGNEKKFVLTPGDWMTAYVGTDICISNQSKW